MREDESQRCLLDMKRKEFDQAPVALLQYSMGPCSVCWPAGYHGIKVDSAHTGPHNEFAHVSKMYPRPRHVQNRLEEQRMSHNRNRRVFIIHVRV